jgi:hypothetical protein
MSQKKVTGEPMEARPFSVRGSERTNKRKEKLTRFGPEKNFSI